MLSWRCLPLSYLVSFRRRWRRWRRWRRRLPWVNRFGISRNEQDKFALRSHQNAAKAHADGIYVEEVGSGAMGCGPVADATHHSEQRWFLFFPHKGGQYRAQSIVKVLLCGVVQYSTTCCRKCTTRYDIVRYGLILYAWNDPAWQRPAWCGAAWYTRYGVVWCGMVRFGM